MHFDKFSFGYIRMAVRSVSARGCRQLYSPEGLSRKCAFLARHFLQEQRYLGSAVSRMGSPEARIVLWIVMAAAGTWCVGWANRYVAWLQATKQKLRRTPAMRCYSNLKAPIFLGFSVLL